MGANRVIAMSRDVTPEAFVKALTEFDQSRSSTWGNAEGKYLQVHKAGDNWVEVTEGTSKVGGIWQRSRYDWSTPGRVRLDVLDGNPFGEGSWWEYLIEPAGPGCRVSLTVSRSPRSVRGRVLDALLTVFGSFQFRRDLDRSLRLIAGTKS